MRLSNFLFMPGSVAVHAKTNPSVRIGRTIRFHRNMRSAFWLLVSAVLAWERIVRTVVSVGEGSDGKNARVETHLEPLSSAREDVLVLLVCQVNRRIGSLIFWRRGSKEIVLSYRVPQKPKIYSR